ncbi:hypothetical protein N598_22625 [Klebsiella pneumoniae 303K]|nr:hypothetical protein N598_22625 [Klebsiella pneumoniae 303K]
MTLSIQKVDLDKAVQYFATTSITPCERSRLIAFLGYHFRIETCGIKNKIAEFIFVIESIAKIFPKITR